MAQQIFHKHFASWHFAKLEQFLDAQSEQGYQLVTATHKKQVFSTGGTPSCHRLGYCPSRPDSADAISYIAAQEQAGWELVCQEQGWLYFRRPLDTDSPSIRPRLAEDRDAISQMFAGICKRLENWRIIELLLTAALVIIGYATTNLVMQLAVIPLLLVLLNTYLIKFMQESLENDALE